MSKKHPPISKKLAAQLVYVTSHQTQLRGVVYKLVIKDHPATAPWADMDNTEVGSTQYGYIVVNAIRKEITREPITGKDALAKARRLVDAWEESAAETETDNEVGLTRQLVLQDCARVLGQALKTTTGE